MPEGMTAAAGTETARPVPGLAALFAGFVSVSAFAFGGVLPWARLILVERRGWLTPDEFTDVLSLCQFLPGPNIVNVSIAVGGRFRGIPGAIAAVTGLWAIPIVLVLSLGALYTHYGESEAVSGALGGIAAGAAGLVVAMVAKMVGPLLGRRWVTTVPMMLLAFAAIGIMRWPLLPVLLVLAPVAIALAWRRR